MSDIFLASVLDRYMRIQISTSCLFYYFVYLISEQEMSILRNPKKNIFDFLFSSIYKSSFPLQINKKSPIGLYGFYIGGGGKI